MAERVTDSLPALLRSAGPEREEAARELRDLLLRAALAYLVRQRYAVEMFGADSYDSIAEDVAQESLAIILTQLDTFRGECRFTTWAYRIVINLIADEMRRRAWRRRPLQTEEQGAAEWRAPAAGLDTVAERRAVWNLVEQAIRHDLTARQRQALVGRIFEEKPLVVLAAELETNKDNVYKLLHDARKALKRALLARGLTTAEALSAFQGETT